MAGSANCCGRPDAPARWSPALGWIRAHDSGAWRTIGDRSLPPPIVRALRYEHRLRDYAPNDPPLWDRLLHALHERGGTSFDPDEAVSPREYLDVDPRLDANAGFGQ